MIDFDPRDHDSRPDERLDNEGGRGGRGTSNGHDRDDDWSQPEGHVHGHDDHVRDLGRGPGSTNRNDDSSDGRRNPEDVRWAERDHDARGLDPRDVFMRDLDLPRGREREIVYDTRERA